MIVRRSRACDAWSSGRNTGVRVCTAAHRHMGLGPCCPLRVPPPALSPRPDALQGQCRPLLPLHSALGGPSFTRGPKLPFAGHTALTAQSSARALSGPIVVLGPQGHCPCLGLTAASGPSAQSPGSAGPDTGQGSGTGFMGTSPRRRVKRTPSVLLATPKRKALSRAVECARFSAERPSRAEREERKQKHYGPVLVRHL